MHSRDLAYSTPMQVPRWRRWLVYSPLARIVIFVLLLAAFSLAGIVATSALGWTAKEAGALTHATANLIARALPALLAYLLLVRCIEQRWPAELAWRRLLPDALGGIAVGVLILVSVIGILWLLGAYTVTGSHAEVGWLAQILMLGIVPAIGEEIVARGVLFRISEEGLGTWAALLISALFFGGAHLGNPNATLWSSLAIAIEAGILLGLIYHVTRSLYACMGVHAAWNIMEGTVFGTMVSGTQATSWLQARMQGPDWLTGGAFGPEASVLALAACTVPSLLMLAWMWRHRTVVRPAWVRRRQDRGDRQHAS